MKKVFSVILAAMMLLSLVACGGGSGEDVTGKYVCVSATYSDGFGEPAGEWVELAKDGKGTYYGGGGTEFDLEWKLSGDTFTGKVIFMGMENAMEGTLKDGVLDVKYGDVNMRFEKQGGTTGTANTAELTAYQEYWNGGWYGWMMCYNGVGESAEWNNRSWDCLAKIEVDENNEGGLIIWDEASSMDNPMIGVTFTVSEGSNEYGQLDSESGYFWDCDIGAGDLVIEAENTYFEHMVIIEGTYTDPIDASSYFDYTIMIKPWGMDWADVEEEHPNSLPDSYHDWYLPAIQYGEEMPDVIGGE